MPCRSGGCRLPGAGADGGLARLRQARGGPAHRVSCRCMLQLQCSFPTLLAGGPLMRPVKRCWGSFMHSHSCRMMACACTQAHAACAPADGEPGRSDSAGTKRAGAQAGRRRATREHEPAGREPDLAVPKLAALLLQPAHPCQGATSITEGQALAHLPSGCLYSASTSFGGLTLWHAYLASEQINLAGTSLHCCFKSRSAPTGLQPSPCTAGCAARLGRGACSGRRRGRHHRQQPWRPPA